MSSVPRPTVRTTTYRSNVIPAAGLVIEAWSDFDRVVDGVSAEEAVRNPEGQSSIAWTLGHVTEHVDRMVNHGLRGRDRHAFLGADRFRMGSAGVADDWDPIVAATKEIRGAALRYLETLTEADLDRRFDSPGAITKRLGPITVRYALYRIAAHHYFHIGVIACQRDLRGESVGDYPGFMTKAN